MTENKCENCINKTKLLFEQFKSSMEDQGRYISIIGSVFYVSILSFFCLTAKDYSLLTKKHFIISFTVSVSLFVINEIIGMIRNYQEYRFKTNEWQRHSRREITLEQLETNINNKIIDLYKISNEVWIFLFTIGTVSGVWAVLSLIIAIFRIY